MASYVEVLQDTDARFVGARGYVHDIYGKKYVCKLYPLNETVQFTKMLHFTQLRHIGGE